MQNIGRVEAEVAVKIQVIIINIDDVVCEGVPMVVSV